MIPRGRVSVVLASLLALSCDDLREPLDLDQIDEPSEACVVVVHEALDFDAPLHAYVADRPTSVGGWALITVVDEFGGAELTLVRVPDSPAEPATEPVGLGYPSLATTRVELRAGAVPGELWVLQDSGTAATLRKLSPGVGVVVGNPSIANFPADAGESVCPNNPSRQLLLIEGRPYVLGLPSCSDSPALDVELLELHTSTLAFQTSWVLTFDPCAGQPDCGLATFPYTLAPIRRGESTHVANAERVAVGFTQVRDFGGGVTSSDVSLLELRLVASGPTARLITFRQVWITPTNLGEVRLAQDPFSVQLHVRNLGSLQDAALLRFDAIGELYIQLETPQLLPLDGFGELVQLDTQSAMLGVRDGALEAVPLDDVASWPTWDTRTLLELDDLVAFEPAGVGQLLLRREDAPAQVIALRCLR